MENLLKNRTVLITGGTRGIGKAIGLRAARDGANVVILGKTTEPHPNLPGTIWSAAKEMEAAGGRALAVPCDIRIDEQVEAAVAQTVERYGGIDILINNASAIFLAGTLQTPMKRFDLMHQVNTRGTFLASQLCLPHLLKSSNPHILCLAPPIDMDCGWFAGTLPYTMAKYGMSQCVLGLSQEFQRQGVAVNALWPETGIATAAVANLLGGESAVKCCRIPEIVADAAHAIVSCPSRECTGNFFIDSEVLASSGVTDFDQYAISPGVPLMPDFFLGKPDFAALSQLLHGENQSTTSNR
ncbi:MAG: NAD(P)-dependent oxidoreductase [Planctomycetota bacterium]|nr:NAD(P)-dependent oxidoreductase [Planctomycetota bacterium]